MSKLEKDVNKAITVAAIGLGAYAILKSISKGAEGVGEGMLGGTEEQLEELDDAQGFASKFIDPNTIPDQPLTEPIMVTDRDPIGDPVIKPVSDPYVPTIDSIRNLFDVPTMPDTISTPTITGILGTDISAGEAGLGLAGLLPSPITTIGKKIGTAIKPTPKVSYPVEKIAVKATVSETGEEVIEKASRGVLKSGLKKGGKVLVGSVPLIGIAAGSEFDVAVDERPRWLAYPANILGDLVGGILGVVTAPAALTGIGAVIPVTAAIGGQVATESLIYGGYDILTGKDKIETDVAVAPAQTVKTAVPIDTTSSYLAGTLGIEKYVSEPVSTPSPAPVSAPISTTPVRGSITSRPPSVEVKIISTPKTATTTPKTSTAAIKTAVPIATTRSYIAGTLGTEAYN